MICDVNEYRKCVKEDTAIPMVTELFERLHRLCNLLVVVPENLKVVRHGEQLVIIIISFISHTIEVSHLAVGMCFTYLVSLYSFWR